MKLKTVCAHFCRAVQDGQDNKINFELIRKLAIDMNETFMCAYETDSLHMHAEVKVRVSEPESLFPVQLILTSEDILELNQCRNGNQNPVVTLSSEFDKKKLDWNLIPVNVLIFCSGFDGSVADKLLVLSQTNTGLRINQNVDIRTAANTERRGEHTY